MRYTPEDGDPKRAVEVILDATDKAFWLSSSGDGLRLVAIIGAFQRDNWILVGVTSGHRQGFNNGYFSSILEPIELTIEDVNAIISREKTLVNFYTGAENWRKCFEKDELEKWIALKEYYFTLPANVKYISIHKALYNWREYIMIKTLETFEKCCEAIEHDYTNADFCGIDHLKAPNGENSHHLIVTNDIRLISKYRAAMSLAEFEREYLSRLSDPEFGPNFRLVWDGKEKYAEKKWFQDKFYDRDDGTWYYCDDYSAWLVDSEVQAKAEQDRLDRIERDKTIDDPI